MRSVMGSPEATRARAPEAGSRLVQISVLREASQIQQKVLNLRRREHLPLHRQGEEGFDLIDQRR